MEKNYLQVSIKGSTGLRCLREEKKMQLYTEKNNENYHRLLIRTTVKEDTVERYLKWVEEK